MSESLNPDPLFAATTAECKETQTKIRHHHCTGGAIQYSTSRVAFDFVVVLLLLLMMITTH